MEFHNEILEVSDANGKRFALIETSNNYIVACDYDPSRRWEEQWEHGIYYMFSNEKERLISLNKATEMLRYKTENNYISRQRLEELATQFKDQIVEISLYDCNATVAEIVKIFEEMELEDYEKEFFGLNEIEENTDEQSDTLV